LREAAAYAHESWRSKLERMYRAISMGIDIVEFPLNVNEKSCSELSEISQSFELNADG